MIIIQSTPIHYTLHLHLYNKYNMIIIQSTPVHYTLHLYNKYSFQYNHSF